MKTTVAAMLVVAIGSVMAVGSQEGAKKEVTLKGEIACAKCALKEATKCMNAIQVKEGDKTMTYLFDDKGSAESYHEEVCGGERKLGTVTGTVSEKDGKKWIQPKKVEYSKAK